MFIKHLPQKYQFARVINLGQIPVHNVFSPGFEIIIFKNVFNKKMKFFSFNSLISECIFSFLQNNRFENHNLLKFELKEELNSKTEA